MERVKIYNNTKKSRMYVVDTTSRGIVREIKLWDPDGKAILNGKIDHKKNQLKFSEIKKEGVLEYIVFLLYYPKMLLKVLKDVPTSKLKSVLEEYNISNKTLIKNVIALRRKTEKNLLLKKAKSKRKL